MDADVSQVPEVEVLVLNFNGRHHLDRCLQSLQQQNYPRYKVALLDNGSSDGSSEYVVSQYPWVRVRTFTENLGYARAYNLGIQESDAPLVALLNNDAYVTQTWLEELVRAILEHPQAAACTSRIRFADGSSRLHHAGGTLTYAGVGWDMGFGQLDGLAYDQMRYVGSFSGAATLLRREVFLRNGGFDPEFFAYCEDTDLSWRLWLLGQRVLYVPAALVYHQYGATGGGRLSPVRVYHAQRNRLASMVKNIGASAAPLAVALSVGFDLFRCFNYLRAGRSSLLRALITGTFETLRDLPGLLARRSVVQKARVVSDKELESLGVLASPQAAIREYLRLERLASRQRTGSNPERRKGPDSGLLGRLESR